MAKQDHELTWRDLKIGCVVTEVEKEDSASSYKTGDWRSQRPIYDFSKCIKCGRCAIFCPEPCIEPNEEGYFEADLFYCKGCGICAREGPTGVIIMVTEEEK